MSEVSTTERLLDAAWSEAVGRGIEQLTLARVGAVAGVSRQTVYLHFGNRASLLVAMAARVDRTSGFRKQLAAAHRRPPREGYRRLLGAWFGYVPTILPVHLALEAAALSGGDGAAAYQDRMTDWRTGIRVAVARLQDSGDLVRTWSVDDATDWTWAMVHPTHYHHLTAERQWTSGVTRRRLIASLERELLVPAEED